ncbi:MAG: hypothetical protein LAO19_02075 [Acidobacteriia bacterium]|nr:hypothetical protein [Terriglobia bacterium]
MSLEHEKCLRIVWQMYDPSQLANGFEIAGIVLLAVLALCEIVALVLEKENPWQHRCEVAGVCVLVIYVLVYAAEHHYSQIELARLKEPRRVSELQRQQLSNGLQGIKELVEVHYVEDSEAIAFLRQIAPAFPGALKSGFTSGPVRATAPPIFGLVMGSSATSDAAQFLKAFQSAKLPIKVDKNRLPSCQDQDHQICLIVGYKD